ncbi:hypothetical protein PAT3040_00122 [Paenibacillus agaridevorans]|uniref:SLH domain-containing protein n=1 Tax=Paenibacillus agaridevorans TaxID=171404 RepID=A0A2R5EKZ0_9BACL|nr:S-layer homology domain-containing protein [Paenibacillus agaridevorans]GBG05638.1 hypothetical protein PAT3040_00122 [Paenibacillus agaridevorans]
MRFKQLTASFLAALIVTVGLLPPLAGETAGAAAEENDYDAVENASVESIDGIPTLHINNQPQPLVGWFQWDWYPGMTQSADYAGIRIYQPRHTTGYPTLEVWLPHMQEIAEQDPNAYFLPVIWMGSNTPFGFDEKNSSDVHTDTGASWGAISYGSDEWQNRAELLLREQIRRYEASPVGDRILGYMLSAGSTAEWFYVDTWANRDFDRSVSNKAKFRQWLQERYNHDVAKLREAWNDAYVTFESADIPAKASGDPFLNPGSQSDLIDYAVYHNEIVSERMTYLSHVVKEEVEGRKLAAVYGGYTMAFGQYGPLSGMLDFETLLRNDDIDLLYSPLDYTHRDLDDGFTSVHGAMDSARLYGKLYVGEDDYATHMGTDTHGAPPLANDIEGSLALLWRNFGFTLSKNYGIHWYDDAGYGGFHNARMMNNIRLMNQLAEAAVDLPRRSTTEIALVLDEFSQLIQSAGGSPVNERVRLIREELSAVGAPYDIVLLSDVLAGKTDPYKLYIMANAYAWDNERLAQLENWDKTGKTLVWLYAAGYWKRDADGVDSRSAGHMASVTGVPSVEIGKQSFEILPAESSTSSLLSGIDVSEPLGGSVPAIPLYAAVGYEAAGFQLLGQTGSHATAVYKEHAGGAEVWIGSPSISSELLYRNLADLAGVHLYSRSGKQVNANESFVFVTLPEAGTETIRFPDASPRYDIIAGEFIFPDSEGDVELSTDSAATFAFFNGNPADLKLNRQGEYATDLDRLVLRLEGETLKEQQLESLSDREFETIAGSDISFALTGITSDGYYFYEDEMEAASLWSSSNENVAIVDSEGRVSALEEGQTVITATSSGVVASALLTISAPLEESLMQRMPTAFWSTWSMANGWHPFTFGEGNEYGIGEQRDAATAENGENYTQVFRYAPLQNGEQISGSLDSLQVPNKTKVKAIATFRYPQGATQGVYNSVIMEGYTEGGGSNIFVVQKDLPVTGKGTSVEVDLSAYAGQKIRIDLNVRHKGATSWEDAEVLLTDYKFVYEDETPVNSVTHLEFDKVNTTVKPGTSGHLQINEVYSDGSRGVWLQEENAHFYNDRPDIVQVDNTGHFLALKEGTAQITLVTDHTLTRGYVHVSNDGYVYEDLLDVYEEEGSWTAEPTYAGFPFGSWTEYGGASRPESVVMEDGNSYEHPIVLAGSDSGTGINGRISLEVPDQPAVFLTGKFGFVGESGAVQRQAKFFMRSWDTSITGSNPFYQEYTVSDDGALSTFEIDISAFAGETLETTDIYLLKENGEGSSLEIALTELAFRMLPPDVGKPVALIADRPHLVLPVNGQDTLTVTELNSQGHLRQPAETVTWSTNHNDTVTVGSDGVIAALQPGIAVVQADMGPMRTFVVVEVRPEGMSSGQSADPYRWTSLQRLPQFSLMEADIPYFYIGPHRREAVMAPPVVTTVSEPTGTVGQANVTIEGTAMNGALVQVWQDSNGNASVDSWDKLAATKRLTDGSEFVIEVPLDQEGVYHFLLTGANEWGERSKETVVPEIQYVLPAGQSYSRGTDPERVKLLLNGRTADLGREKRDQSSNGFSVTYLLDYDKLLSSLVGDEGAIIEIALDLDNPEAALELDGKSLELLGNRKAFITLQTSSAYYTLNAAQLQEQFLSGAEADDDGLLLRVVISEVAESERSRVAKSLKRNGLELIGSPIRFELMLGQEGRMDPVDTFDFYVERGIKLPSEAEKIFDKAAAFVVDEQGEVRPVPAILDSTDDRKFVQIRSLTNSLYALAISNIAFLDMKGHWGQGAVEDMARRLVVSGYANGQFKPDAAVTRAELSVMLARGLGLKPIEGDSAFNDVDASAWYAGWLEAAWKSGLIAGYDDGNFRPDNPVNREEAMVIASRAMILADDKESAAVLSDMAVLERFIDANLVSVWAVPAAANNVNWGLFAGRAKHMLAPKASITRAEAAVVIRRLLSKAGLIETIDQ